MATTNYSWNLPTVGGSEDTWGTDLNANWTALDTLLGGTNATEFAILDGATVSTAELNLLDGVTWPLSDYNALTATAAELNLLDGVTALTGADNVLVTGTAGTNGQYAQWNADGDIVGVTLPTLSEATWEAGTDTTEATVSPAKVKAAVDALSIISSTFSATGGVDFAGGLQLRWGSRVGTGGVTFDSPFSNAFLGAVTATNTSASANVEDTWYGASVSGLTVTSLGGHRVYYFAWGY